MGSWVSEFFSKSHYSLRQSVVLVLLVVAVMIPVVHRGWEVLLVGIFLKVAVACGYYFFSKKFTLGSNFSDREDTRNV